MQALLLESDGQRQRLDTPRVFRVGRSPDADLRVQGDTVSREHLELRPADDGWVLADVGSRHGTFVEGRRVSELRVDRPLRVFLGLQGSGAWLQVSPAEATATQLGGPIGVRGAPVQPVGAPPQQPEGPQPQPGGVRPPQHPDRARPQQQPDGARPQQQPGGVRPQQQPGLDPAHGLDPALAMTQAVEMPPLGAHGPQTGPDVIVRVEGTDHRFSHPTSVTIGRHPGNTIVCTNPSVSRLHARIDPRPGGWVFSNASGSGSFVDEQPVERLELDDARRIRLGHPTAGLEIEVAPVLPAREVQQRAARRRRQQRLKVLGGAVLAVLLVVGLVFGAIALLGDDDSPPSTPAADTLTSEELDEAKLAAVWIRAVSTTTTGEQAEWFGSGSVISPDGVILTNAHVADPQADGLQERYGPIGLVTPEYVDIAILDDPDDARAEPAFRARVVASDGHLDASVLQIFATFDGQPVDPADLDLPTVDVGDSDTLSTGDQITVLGFPGISQSPGVTVTNGLVSSFVPDDFFDSDRAEIDTDARIAPGNSGGMAIDNAGELVGIPSSLFGDESSTVVSGRIRAINLVKPLIDEAM